MFMAPTYLYIVVIARAASAGASSSRLTGALPHYVAPPVNDVEAAGPPRRCRCCSSCARSAPAPWRSPGSRPSRTACRPSRSRSGATPGPRSPGRRCVRRPLPGDRLPRRRRSASCPTRTSRRPSSSQLARHVSGDGPYLYLVQISTALLLVLAANTSFADFPRLSSFLARDGYLPRQFAFRGERLAFTTGILALAGLAVALIIGFGAKVSALIPLYTLGVFMRVHAQPGGHAVRWWRRREPGWQTGIVINGQRRGDDVPRPAGRGGQQLHPRRVADHDPGARC